MTRFGWLAVASVLAACSNTAAPQLSTGLPSINTARAALETGAPDVALAICARITQADERDVAAWQCEGDALAALRRTDEADAVYTKALVLQPNQVSTLLRLGRIRLAGNPKRAEALFLQALKEAPRDAVLLNDLGIARDLQGRHADAQDAYGKAIGADPGLRAAQINLALSVALSGRPGDAARMLPTESSPTAPARERHDMAAVLAMDGRLDEAKRLLAPELAGADLDAAIAGYRSFRPSLAP